MTVVFDTLGMREPKPHCAVCGIQLYRYPVPSGGFAGYPYLEWTPSGDWEPEGNELKALCICGECIVKIEYGLIADIIQLSALVRISRLPHQRCELTRASCGTHQKEHDYHEREGLKLLFPEKKK